MSEPKKVTNLEYSSVYSSYVHITMLVYANMYTNVFT